MHSRSEYDFKFLELSTLDGDNHLVPYAFGIIAHEDGETCRAFLRHVFDDAPNDSLRRWATSPEHVFFADRGPEAGAIDWECVGPRR